MTLSCMPISQKTKKDQELLVSATQLLLNKSEVKVLSEEQQSIFVLEPPVSMVDSYWRIQAHHTYSNRVASFQDGDRVYNQRKSVIR